MVSVCTVPARGGRSCEHFGGYKTLNRIPLHKCRTPIKARQGVGGLDSKHLPAVGKKTVAHLSVSTKNLNGPVKVYVYLPRKSAKYSDHISLVSTHPLSHFFYIRL